MRSDTLSLRIHASVAALLLAASATAGDGRFELNQECALSGCNPSDVAGYPIFIFTPGSYVLTSSLQTTDLDDSAIVLAVDGVAIDLAGFEIAGPVTCTGSGDEIVCDQGGASAGISAANRDRIQVRNGRIRGFGIGITTRDLSQVRDVDVYSCRSGIEVNEYSMVTNSKVFGTQFNGIVGLRGLVLSDNVSARNGVGGITTPGTGNVLLRNATYENGASGLLGETGSVLASNSSILNGGVASVWVNSGGLVVGNTVQQSTAAAVRAEGLGSSVQDNTIRVTVKCCGSRCDQAASFSFLSS